MSSAVMNFLQEQKGNIAEYLRSFCTGKRSSFSGVNRWGPDVLDRLVEFSLRGKMVRGALVILGHLLGEADISRNSNRSAVEAAAAVELIQSFLLVHDDIMDQDFVRRGQPSLFAQYASVLGEMHSSGRVPEDGRQFGEAMGICAGDVAMLLAFEVLSSLDTDAAKRLEIIQMCSREIGWVGIAQMGDVFHGHSSHAATEEEIFSLYRYKTGRYTFSLPLLVGATLSGLSIEDREALSLFGEQVGMLFQIRDDDLSIWGEESKTGKPIGSDIAENKQTLHRLYLLEAVPPAQRDAVRSLFGNRSSRAANVQEVQVLLREFGVQERIRGVMNDLAAEAERTAQSITSGNPEAKKLLCQLVAYNLDRTA